ncbi:hypothetical protein ACFYVL_40985 [Streptomyces sp. NPDC004111]|uniref:hypothetical protein n=1 Tax=Streptomyces sp. NPDC004111 TaxID=3364690 RepID=UPI0036991D81
MLEPLRGVGPLRFGMVPDQVSEALDGMSFHLSSGRENGTTWGSCDDLGLTLFFGEGVRLVAVHVDPERGPSVRLHDIELIGRVPSEVRADLYHHAQGEGVAVRGNWSGDPEVAAWGVSLGTSLGRDVFDGEDYTGPRGVLLTTALLVAPELAADPFGSPPVKDWWDTSEKPPQTGAWPVKEEKERPLWGFVPMERVGPLRFHMNPQQVTAALSEKPSSRQGTYAFGLEGYARPGPWQLREDRFDSTGVTAYYEYGPDRLPTLAAVTVHGRTGPQVECAGIRLIGRPLSAVNTALLRYIQSHEEEDLGLAFGGDGNIGALEFNLFIKAARAGDTCVSAAQFGREDWHDR